MNLTYCSTQDAADYLNTSEEIEMGDLTSALINALNRIYQLERQLEKLKHEQ